MNDIFLQILTVAYAGVSITGLLGYMPTIKELWYDKKQSATLLSYVIWFIGSVVSFLYGLFIIKDLLFIIFTGTGIILNGIVIFLILRINKKI